MSEGDTFKQLVCEIVDRRVGEHEAAGREPWVDVPTAARHAGGSPDSIREAARSGALPHGRLGSEYRFKLSDVDAWMREQAARKPQSRKRAAAAPSQSPRTREIVAGLERRKAS